MSVELFRLQNAEQLQMPSVKAFVREALATNRLIEDVDAALAELEQLIDAPTVAVVIGHEAGEWAGFVMLQASYSAFNRACAVVHFYNAGSPSMRKALCDAVLKFAEVAGLPKIRGVDINNSPAAFARLFGSRAKARKVGEVFIFTPYEDLL